MIVEILVPGCSLFDYMKARMVVNPCPYSYCLDWKLKINVRVEIQKAISENLEK